MAEEKVLECACIFIRMRTINISIVASPIPIISKTLLSAQFWLVGWWLVQHYVPVTSWTMEEAIMVEILAKDDKWQISAVFCGSMTGDCLPLQLIYEGKKYWSVFTSI